MGRMTNQHCCPICDGYLDYEGVCHTCGFHEQQYAPANDHPRALKLIRRYNVRYGCGC